MSNNQEHHDSALSFFFDLLLNLNPGFDFSFRSRRPVLCMLASPPRLEALSSLVSEPHCIWLQETTNKGSVLRLCLATISSLSNSGCEETNKGSRPPTLPRHHQLLCRTLGAKKPTKGSRPPPWSTAKSIVGCSRWPLSCCSWTLCIAALSVSLLRNPFRCLDLLAGTAK